MTRSEEAMRALWRELCQLRGDEYPPEPPSKWLELAVKHCDHAVVNTAADQEVAKRTRVAQSSLSIDTTDKRRA